VCDVVRAICTTHQGDWPCSRRSRIYLLGFLSVIGSIFVWYSQGGVKSGEERASGERFGIFVGLWAPTFFALGNGIAQTEE
jgi:hypothetical protein